MLFAVSIVVRYNNLTAPLDRREEWQTGHVLVTLKIWEQNGIANHYFSPVCTFNSPGDKITNSLGGIRDVEGYTYYVSYPPLSFILPYIVFKLSGQDVSVSGIRVFSLLIHFCCALLTLLILYKFFGKRFKADVFIPGYVAFCLYLFSTGNLWFHGNFYFADSLVHVFVLGAIYLMLFIYTDPKNKIKIRTTTLFLLIFSGVYTEWLALFFSILLLLALALICLNKKHFLPYLIATISGLILALTLCLFQYKLIAGPEALEEFLLAKFSGRSGLFEQSSIDNAHVYNHLSYKTIYSNYISNYSYLIKLALLCFTVFLILCYVNRKSKKEERTSGAISLFLILCGTILLHHILFFNFTAIHDISTLKATLPICLFIGYVVGVLSDSIPERGVKLVAALTILVVGGFTFYSLREYSLINAGHADSYAQKLVGEVAKNQSNPEETVFTNVGVSPVLMWYAQRNPVWSVNTENCRKILDSLNYKSGVFFNVTRYNNQFHIKTIRLLSNGDSLVLN